MAIVKANARISRKNNRAVSTRAIDAAVDQLVDNLARNIVRIRTERSAAPR